MRRPRKGEAEARWRPKFDSSGASCGLFRVDQSTVDHSITDMKNMIMSVDASRRPWKQINSIKRFKTRMAVYHLGCKCQELESKLDGALDRIEALEAKEAHP